MVEKFTLLGNKHFNLFASIRQLAELFCVQCCVMRKVQIANSMANEPALGWGTRE